MKKIEKFAIGFILLGFIVGGYVLVNAPSISLGNSILSRHSNCKTSSATSSPSVIASTTYPAVAVSIVCDAYNLDSTNYDATPMDSAVLALQYTAASTTASNISVAISYSNDAIDWYTPVLDPDEVATTSIALTNTVTTPVNKLFDIITPTRYVKATFTTTYEGGVATSSVWAEFIPKRTVK